MLPSPGNIKLKHSSPSNHELPSLHSHRCSSCGDVRSHTDRSPIYRLLQPISIYCSRSIHQWLHTRGNWKS
ncbi:hypothetical protein PMAYCL1PPCAC_04777 [Pristionchus mayeri]|uniref:Uncharacterized protein n=1 Tax=Pristionchus mayeri TaxID=1317129 RepID=A0AAN4Z4Y7_9BILA|nr:hypothetical protein PMAYCL1PPCAC_04777 [Pristionchus mayeri]